MRHALLARQLIAACGGTDEAATACRLNRSRLFEIQQPSAEAAFMPADVIADLEAYCGEALYSRALAEARPTRAPATSALAEACDAVEAAARLLAVTRAAAADGKLTAQELRSIETAAADLEEQLREFRASVDQGLTVMTGGVT